MKCKQILGTMLLFIYGALAFAQTTTTPRMDMLAPKDARTMAMGGAFLAMSQGFQSFYGNPASFTAKKAELTVLSVNPWVYFAPTTANMDLINGIISSGNTEISSMVGPISDLLTGNGFGAGASVGIGWVGKGLAIGVLGGADAYLYGPNLLGAQGNLDGQIALVAGIGIPIKLGPLVLNVGGDIRPFLRMSGKITSKELMGVLGAQMGPTVPGTSTANPEDALLALPVGIGFGMAVDLGASVDLLKFLSVGLSIRDITTKQNYARLPLSDALDKLTTGQLPEPDSSSALSVYPNITAGASLTPIPESMRKLLDIIVIMELQDPIKVIADNGLFWNLVHLGTEVKLLNGLVKARAGMNKGWVSFGVGLDLFISEINVALFTEEMGKRPGDRGRTGLSAEIAFRF